MKLTRRSVLTSGIKSGSFLLAASGSMAGLISGARPAQAGGWFRPPQKDACFTGYGNLVADPAGLLDLPKGFRYAVLSPEGGTLSDGTPVPSLHDGMAAFPAPLGGSLLVRNHEVDLEEIEEEGAQPVAKIDACYDPEGVGGTTTLSVSAARRLLDHRISLSGTLTNCAGGPTPWNTWLTCEETTEKLAKLHGYVFEVDPRRGGNAEPIVPLGRFEHEAVSFGRDGIAYLTEDAEGPAGCFYRFLPAHPLGGRGSLHAGGRLQALVVPALAGVDLSAVQVPTTLLRVGWVDVPNPNPGEHDTSVREQAIALGAVPIPSAEGTWIAPDGSIFFVSSSAAGPDAEDEQERTTATHVGQIWRYEPFDRTIQMVTILHVGTPFDEPDNITVGPHGFALACTDGEDDQWLVGINDGGGTFPFARNAENDAEFAGATFARDGNTLFANVQGPPARTYAIWGHWRS